MSIMTTLIPVLMMFIPIVLCAVFLGLWAKEDAEERGMGSPVMWGLIVALVPNLIGLIIYLVVRSTYQGHAACPDCGGAVPLYAGYCPRCGSPQAQPVTGQPATVRNSRKWLRAYFICLGVVVLCCLVFAALAFRAFGQVTVTTQSIQQLS
jgi:hypothetical protein